MRIARSAALDLDASSRSPLGGEGSRRASPRRRAPLSGLSKQRGRSLHGRVEATPGLADRLCTDPMQLAQRRIDEVHDLSWRPSVIAAAGKSLAERIGKVGCVDRRHDERRPGHIRHVGTSRRELPLTDGVCDVRLRDGGQRTHPPLLARIWPAAEREAVAIGGKQRAPFGPRTGRSEGYCAGTQRHTENAAQSYEI